MAQAKLRKIIRATIVPWLQNHFAVAVEYENGRTENHPVGSRKDAEELVRLVMAPEGQTLLQ